MQPVGTRLVLTESLSTGLWVGAGDSDAPRAGQGICTGRLEEATQSLRKQAVTRDQDKAY